ncbi:MAG: hypothetical protein IJU98_06510 [Synergistaceae bacterium]|nr:hypothetical protein [Synergistaceae bacterium]
MKKELKASIAIVVSLAACLCLFLLLYVWLGDGIEIVEQGYVKAHMGKPGYVLLDVREARIFNGASPLIEGVPGGHIPGAVNFPSSELRFTKAAEALEKAGVTKDVTIIIYCNKGILSSIFADTLVKEFGYSPRRIKHYRNSMLDWAKGGDNPILPEDHEL